MATFSSVKSNIKHIFVIIGAGLLLFLGIIIISINVFHFRVPVALRCYIESCLTVKEQLPAENVDALYILGGSAHSMTHHIERAANLFHNRKTKNLLLLDSQAKWHYEPELGRNITRNELYIRMLVEKGVPKSCIDTIPVKEGFFGTLSEARALEVYLRKNSLHSVILDSSPCHSRRVAFSFGHYLKRSGINMYIASSEDAFSFRELILEAVKVFVYSALQRILFAAT
jgi:hypothetical protein